MKIHVPGIGTQYVDEDPPKVEVKVVGGVSVEEAIRLAQERAGFVPVVPPQTEVLRFTREVGTEAPLVDTSVGVVSPDNVSAQLEHGAVSAPVAVPVEPVSEPAKSEPDPLAEFGASTPSDDLLK